MTVRDAIAGEARFIHAVIVDPLRMLTLQPLTALSMQKVVHQRGEAMSMIARGRRVGRGRLARLWLWCAANDVIRSLNWALKF